MSSVESKRSELDKLLSSDEEEDDDSREEAKKSPQFDRSKSPEKLQLARQDVATKKEYSVSDFTFAKSEEEENKVHTMSAKVSSNSGDDGEVAG